MKLFEISQNKIDNMSSNQASKQAYEYIRIHGPDSKLEDIIATDTMYSYYYARNILNDRFPKGEKIIATSATYSYYYANDVLNGRFLKGERSILKNPLLAFRYATNIMHRRWLKAESVIKESNSWSKYKEYFNIK